MYSFFILCACLSVVSIDSSPLPSPETNQSTPIISSLLENASNEWDFPHGEDLIVLLGNTKAGKSTLASLLADQDDFLFSVENAERGFEIKDMRNKTSGGNKSHTIYPELYRGGDNTTIYCDTAGFYDSRGSDYVEFNDLLLKNVLKHAKRVKLVLNIPKPRMDQVVDDLPKMLERISNLIVNVSKYQNSLALVVNRYPWNITFEQAQKDIRSKLVEISGERAFDEKTKNILNIFQTNKIGVMKDLNEVGPVNKVSSVVESKIQIRKVLAELSFVKPNQEDFYYPISNYTKIALDNMIQNAKISGKILTDVEKKRLNLLEDLAE